MSIELFTTHKMKRLSIGDAISRVATAGRARTHKITLEDILSIAPFELPSLTPSFPAPTRNSSIHSRIPRIPAVSATVAAGAAIATQYQVGEVPDTSTVPYSAVGTLVVRVKEEAAGVERLLRGTAWVVGRRGLITAGHCLFSQGYKAQSATFYPRFPDSNPSGFEIASYTYHPQWGGNNYYLAYDFGACVTRNDIANITGKLGYSATGIIPDGLAESVGYPKYANGGFNFDGSRMWKCTSDPFPAGSFHRVPCPFTKGASGGPWIVQTQSGPKVVGMNSWIDDPHQGAMHSPIFDNDFLLMLEWLNSEGALV